MSLAAAALPRQRARLAQGRLQLACAAQGASALAASVALVVLQGLAGCATTPAPAPDVLSGRLSVRVDSQPPQAFSADFELAGTPAAGSLLLSGPLGAGALRARWQPGEALLERGGTTTRHDDLDALTAAALGEALPVAALFDWLRGRPWPGAAAQARADGGPGFSQLGWQVDLSGQSDGLVQARRSSPPAVQVRARLVADQSAAKAP